jgi:hypothetical protein
MIGGLAIVPTTTMQSASASHGEAHGAGGAACVENVEGHIVCSGFGGGEGVGGGGGGGSGFIITGP